MQGTGDEIYRNKFFTLSKNIIDNSQYKNELNGFLNYMMMENKSVTTIYNYIGLINNFLNSLGKSVSDLTLDDYTERIATLYSSSSSYQVLMYSALKEFSKYLYQNKIAPYFYMQEVRKPKFVESKKTKDKREKGYLTKEEIRMYINNVKNGIGSDASQDRREEWKERDLLIVLLLLNTGMRRMALSKLDISDVHLDTMIITTTDKGRVVNVYNISPDLMEYVNAWLAKRKKILGGKEENALFISNRKERLSAGSIYKTIKLYGANIKGKNITPHKLRATYGTQLYDQTRDLYFVSSCMGHKSPKTTEMYIRGTQNEARRISSEIMSNLTLGSNYQTGSGQTETNKKKRGRPRKNSNC